MSAAILTVVQGQVLQAAIEAGDLAEQHANDQNRALALELEQAQYQAALAARRYEAVDPDNRLVAAELEARWNSALERVAELEGRQGKQARLAASSVRIDRGTLESLATDLRTVWDAPSSEMRVKQRIVRLLIQEIIVDADEPTRQIVLIIHWAGGRHSEMRIPRPMPGEHRHRTGPDAEGVVRRMAGAWPDHEIAACLNRLGLRTGVGNTWTASRVLSLRKRLHLVDYDEAAAKPMFTLYQAADRLGVGPWVVRRLIRRGLLDATQVVPCAPLSFAKTPSGGKWAIYQPDHATVRIFVSGADRRSPCLQDVAHETIPRSLAGSASVHADLPPMPAGREVGRRPLA